MIRNSSFAMVAVLSCVLLLPARLHAAAPTVPFARRPCRDTPVPRPEFSEFVRTLGVLFERWNRVKYSPQASPEEIADQRKPYIDEIDATVTAYILARLNAPSMPSANALQDEVDCALTEAQVHTIYAGLYDETTKANAHIEFGFSLQDQVTQPTIYVVGFGIGWGNVFNSVIHGFALRKGKFDHVVQIEPQFFENRILRSMRLKSPRSREMRFIAFGGYIGSPQGLLKAVLYRFDGRKLEALWQKDRVPNGEIALHDSLVILTWYDNIPGMPLVYNCELYKQVKSGLKLEKTEQTPWRRGQPWPPPCPAPQALR